MTAKIEIYQSNDNQTQIEVKFESDTLWLNQYQIEELFETDRTSILKHIKNIYSTGELDENATCAKIAQVQKEGKRNVERKILHYNLDVVISLGYRVNSIKGTLFRKWATKKLNDYLVQGFVINEQRLKRKNQELESLKTGIRILSRAVLDQENIIDRESIKVFSKGLELLDDYDNENLDSIGKDNRKAIYPTKDEYLDVINGLNENFSSSVFAKLKDNSFESSISQIGQVFDGFELYPSLQEKAATLLYLIVKNHSFIDGNKRIGAACFLLFLLKNGLLYNLDGKQVISNDALAALTLFIATSKPEEMNIVKKFVISVLNRNIE